MIDPLYLDGFATMPLAVEAREAMLDALALPTNASSPHVLGERAARIVDSGSQSVGILFDASPREIIFTPGATEANNIAIIGGARSADRKRWKADLSFLISAHPKYRV